MLVDDSGVNKSKSQVTWYNRVLIRLYHKPSVTFKFLVLNDLISITHSFYIEFVSLRRNDRRWQLVPSLHQHLDLIQTI